MSEDGPALEALGYLQTQLSAVIQHDDQAEYVSVPSPILQLRPMI